MWRCSQIFIGNVRRVITSLSSVYSPAYQVAGRTRVTHKFRLKLERMCTQLSSVFVEVSFHFTSTLWCHVDKYSAGQETPCLYGVNEIVHKSSSLDSVPRQLNLLHTYTVIL